MIDYAYRFARWQDVLRLQVVTDPPGLACVPDSRSLCSFNAYNHECVAWNIWDNGMLLHRRSGQTSLQTADTSDPVTLVRSCTSLRFDMVPGPVAFGDDLTPSEWFPRVSVQNLQYATEA